jgi:hypothetical protein
MKNQYEDFSYHTDVFWLSYHRVLKRLCVLRNEIIISLEVREQNVTEIESTERVQDQTFPVDITRDLPTYDEYASYRKSINLCPCVTY